VHLARALITGITGFAGGHLAAPDDYVSATGETHTVQALCEAAIGYLGLDWREYVECDPQFLRPAEVDVLLVGDASKTRDKLGWEPSVGFEELIQVMVDTDLKSLQTNGG
jgi:GDPmannose 4,6-dehydratase